MNVQGKDEWNVLAEFVRTRYGKVFSGVIEETYADTLEKLVTAEETKVGRLQGRAEVLREIRNLFKALEEKGERRG